MDVTPPLAIPCDIPWLRLWHKGDQAFRSPRQYVLAQIHMKAYEAGPEVIALTRLFCNVVNDDLNNFSYGASIAGLSYTLEFSDNLFLSVGGFSDKLPMLLRSILDRIGEVLIETENAGAEGNGSGERGQELLEKLDTQRQILLQDYRNLTREEPSSVSSYYASLLMLRGSWHVNEYCEVLEQPLSLKALASTVRSTFGRAQMEVFVHGNATKDDAIGIAQMFGEGLKVLDVEALSEFPVREVIELPERTSVIFEYDLAADNEEQENSSTQNIYQVGPMGEDLDRDACLVLVCQMAGNSMYQRLRTEEQLGYVVQAGMWGERHVCGIEMLIQGDRLPPREVDERMEAWLGAFRQDIEHMPDEEFQEYITAAISERTRRYALLSQETMRHWSEIQPRTYLFDRVGKIVEALQGLSKAHVISFFDTYFAPSAPQLRKLSVQVLGTSARGAGKHAGADGAILLKSLEDIRAFQASCSSFRVPLVKA